MDAKKSNKCACGYLNFWNSIMYIYEKETTNIDVSDSYIKVFPILATENYDLYILH